MLVSFMFFPRELSSSFLGAGDSTRSSGQGSDQMSPLDALGFLPGIVFLASLHFAFHSSAWEGVAVEQTWSAQECCHMGDLRKSLRVI